MSNPEFCRVVDCSPHTTAAARDERLDGEARRPDVVLRNAFEPRQQTPTLQHLHHQPERSSEA